MSTNPSPSAAGLAQGTFEVDANGQATYKIPLDLPPGIGNFQPSLALAYSHRQPNGVLGVGWALTGLSAITRTKATYAVDGFNAGVSYGPNDRFALDGIRLINVRGDYGAGGTVYNTETQTWAYVLAGATPADGFRVWTKSGELREYGTTADSRILAPGTDQVRVWALAAATDRNGNRVELHYTLSPDGAGDGDGSYFIRQIAYTLHGDGTPANRFVDFRYERRPDPIEDYVAGYPVRLNYRMTEITTSVSAGEVVRTIAIGYRTSTATELSCVASITLSGSASEGAPTLPPTTLVWQDVEVPSFDIGAASTLDQHLGTPDIRTMDVNGDGRTDLVQLWTDNQQSLHATTYLATPTLGGGTIFVRGADTELGAFPAAREIYAADLNGDGKTDLLVVYPGGAESELRLASFLSNGTGFDDAGVFRTGDTWSPKHIEFFAADVNGDGRTDLVEAYAHYDPMQGDLLYFRSYLSKLGDSQGAQFTPGIVSPTTDPAFPTHPLAFWAMDVNGDGMMDVVRVCQDGRDQSIVATAYLGNSRSLDNVSFDSSVTTNLGTLNLPNQIAFLPVDVNGDGVLDLLQIWKEATGGSTTLHFTVFLCNAAGGFVPGPDSAFPDQTIDPAGFFAVDLDGSGLTAIVNKWISGKDRLMFTAFRTSPSGSYRALPPFDAGDAGSTVINARFFPGDVNGDGKADLLRVGVDQTQSVVVVPYASSGAYPDLAASITNSLGGSVAISYAPLSDATVYGPGDPLSFPAGPGARYANPLTPTQYPVQAVLGRATYVVQGYVQADDPARNRFGYTTTNSLTYAGAQLNLLGRGWQGFATVAKLCHESGLVTVDDYNQDFPYTGTKAMSRVEANGNYASDPRVPRGEIVLMSSTATSYTAYVRATGVTSPFPKVYETLRTAMRWETWNYGAFDFALAHHYDYDDFGNENLDAYLGYVDGENQPLDPAEVVYQHRLFQNDVFPEGWALGYLTYAKETRNPSGGDITRFLPGDYHLQARTYAPRTYNLATQGQWDDTQGAYLTASYDYDAFGNKIGDTRPGGFTTAYDFDPAYHTYVMRTTTPPDRQGNALVSTSGYDPRFGVQVANADTNGFVTLAKLDGFGRKQLAQGPVPPGTVGDANALTPLVTGSPELRAAFLTAEVVTTQATLYQDDGQGGLYSEIRALQAFPTSDARDVTWNRSYVDGRGRTRETVRQTGQEPGDAVVLTGYSVDQVSSESFPFFSPTPIVSSAPYATTSVYDVLGRPISRTVPGGPDGNTPQVTTWYYGNGGAVLLTRAAGTPEQYVELQVHHYYNGKDTVISTTVDPEGAAATTTLTYDPVARLTAVVDPATESSPDGVPTQNAYDSLDRRSWTDNPDQNTTGDPDVKAMSFAYDPATGLQSSQTDAAGQTTSYAHDGLGRLIGKTFGDGRSFTYRYDDARSNGNGRLSAVVARRSDGVFESQSDFGYDAYGNVASNVLTLDGEPAPFPIRSVFDPLQRVVRQTYPDGTTMERSFAFGQLVSQSLDGARADYPLADYNPWQRAGAWTGGRGSLPGDGVVTRYTFNPLGQVIGEVVTAAAGTVIDAGYGYDALDQLLAMTDNTGGGGSQSFSYRNARLVSASVPGVGDGSYIYDNAGNLTAKDGVTYTMSAHFATAGVRRGEQVFSASQDACGRTRTRSAFGVVRNFEYDGMSCLRRVSDGGGAMLREMVSDYLGRLLRETDAAGNVTVYVDPAYQVERPAGGGARITKYLLDARGTAATITSDGAAYFRRDFKGSNTHAFGAAGTVIAQIAYGGYGERKVVSGAAFLPEYEQRTYSADIGLYNFGARYYDPMIGRFLTPDSQPGSDYILRADAFNRFCFELNNPVNLVDPTGHSTDAWVGIGIAIALFVIGAAVIVATGGAATPAVVAAGAIIGGGIVGAAVNAGVYSATHMKEQGGSFWKGYAVNASVGFAVGAITGGLATAFSSTVDAAAELLVQRGIQFAVERGVTAVSEQVITKSLQLAARTTLWAAFGGVTTGVGDTFMQFMSNVVDSKLLHDPNVSLTDNLGRAFVTGLGFGAAAGALQGVAETALLKPKSYGVEELTTQPVEMTGMGPNKGTPLLGDANLLYRPNLSVENTVKSRIILFAVSQGTVVLDVTTQTEGY